MQMGITPVRVDIASDETYQDMIAAATINLNQGEILSTIIVENNQVHVEKLDRTTPGAYTDCSGFDGTSLTSTVDEVIVCGNLAFGDGLRIHNTGGLAYETRFCWWELA